MIIRQLTAAALFSLATILPGSAQTANPLVTNCRADAVRLCRGISPGGGRVIGCLRQHEKELSAGCATALQAAKAKPR
jgi:hypothetical protein